MSIGDLFNIIDTDKQGDIDIGELTDMFNKMDLNYLTRPQIQDIFDSIDFDRSGDISKPEFISDFKHYTNSTIEMLKLEENAKKNSEDMKNQQQMMGKKVESSNEQIRLIQLQTKVDMAATREETLHKKVAQIQRILNVSDNARRQIEESNAQIETESMRMKEENFKLKGEVKELQHDKSMMVMKDEHQANQQRMEELITELTETRAAMLSYKNMHNVMGEQVKSLKFSSERKKDEQDNLFEALREMQSDGVTQERLGKLYFVIMLSRWQEAAVNKKYTEQLAECQQLRVQIIELKGHVDRAENQLHSSEQNSIQITQKANQFKHELDKTKGAYISQSKVIEFSRTIKDLGDSKTQLEEDYITLRREYNKVQHKVEENAAKAQQYEELHNQLRRGTQSDLSNKLIELSHTLQQVRVESYKNKRQNDELAEREKHLKRLLERKEDELCAIANKAAADEKALIQEQELFRTRDNERIRQYANQFPDERMQRNNKAAGDKIDVMSNINKAAGLTQSFDSRAPKGNNFGNSFGKTGGSGFGGPGAGASGMGMGNPNTNQELNAEISRLNEENTCLHQEIHGMEAKIKRMEAWNTNDQYLSNEDQQVKDAINKNRDQMFAQNDQDRSEMAGAAQKAVQTLQIMLDQKNQVLEQKEAFIKKMKTQQETAMGLAQEEISKLRRQLTQNGDSALGRMREIIDKHDSHAKVSSMIAKPAQSQLANQSIDEIKLQMNRKDDEIKSLKRQQVAYNDNTSKLKEKINQLNEICAKKTEELSIANKRQDFQRAQKEISILREQARTKDKHQTKLQKCIDELNTKVMNLCSQNSDNSMKNTANEINFKAADSSHAKLIAKEKQATQMAISSRNAAQEESGRLKQRINELDTERSDMEAKIKLAQTEKFDATTECATMRTTLNSRETQVKDLQARLRKAEAGIGDGASAVELQKKNTELMRDNEKLKGSQKQVVAVHPQHGTFDWIGDPQHLDAQRAMSTMDEILEKLKQHLTENHRLTYAPIFHSVNKAAAGSAIKTMSYEQLNGALARIGILLQLSEQKIIQASLDPNNNKKISYEPLVYELQGLPQKCFVNSAVKLLASFAETQPMLKTGLDALFPQTQLTERELKQTIGNLRSQEFPAFTEENYKNLMRHMCKMGPNGTVTATQSFQKTELVEKILQGVEAICIERMQDAIRESGKWLPDLLSKYGKLRQGSLSRNEFEQMMQELVIHFQPEVMQQIVFARLLGNADWLTHDQIKYVFGVGMHSSRPNAAGVPVVEQQKEEQKRRKEGKLNVAFKDGKASVNTVTDHVVKEDDQAAKVAARKVLNAFAQSLQVELHKMDKDNEGIVQTSELKAKITEYINPQSPNALTTVEIDLLTNLCDSRGLGAIVITNFIEKLQKLAEENEYEAKLRWFAMTVGHQGINLRMELGRFDTRKVGVINLQAFKKALKGMSLAQTDAEIDKLYKSGYKACSHSTCGKDTLMDIKAFCDLVREKAREKPPQSFLKIGQQPGSKTSSGTAGAKTSTFETWELEKKYKRNLDALKDTLAEKNAEILTAQGKEQDANRRLLQMEAKKEELMNKLVAVNGKTVAESKIQSRNQGQLDEVQKLNDQVFHLQEVNKALQKTIRVDLKMDLGDMTMEKEKLERQVVDLKQKLKEKEDLARDNLKLNQKGGQNEDYNRQKIDQDKIRELQRDVLRLEEDRDDLEKQLSEEAQLTLELKFEKEGVDLKFARLQKRIIDLEQYKMDSSSLSAELKNQREEELKRIEEESGKLSKEHLTKNTKDTVKIRQKKFKTNQELELVVESLRRVIEKQIVEMDGLKEKNAKLGTLVEKKSNEPAMLLKISDLEAQLETFLKQETNQEDFQKTIKKMVQANKFLREDLDTETQRYRMLEDKYAKLLVEFKLNTKEMQKNEKLIFQKQAGANIENNFDFLEEDQDDQLKFGTQLSGAYGQRKYK